MAAQTKKFQYSDQSYNLRIELDTENFEMDGGEIKRLESTISPLRRLVEDFPVADFYITIQYKPPSHDYRVKTVLRLPGRGLATGDVDENMFAAFRRCINKMTHKIQAYVADLENSEEISKHQQGTRHDVVAQRDVDVQAVDRAVANGEYGEFRKLLYPFEEPVRKRAGRWIQRYPQVEAQLGETFDLADIVEEVFLNAFERYNDHPREVPFGDWLEDLIDPSIKLLSKDTEEELENIRFARTAMEIKRERDRNSGGQA